MKEQAFPSLSTTLKYTVPEDASGVPCCWSKVALSKRINFRLSAAYSLESRLVRGAGLNSGSATNQRMSAKARRMASISRCSLSTESGGSAGRSKPSKIFKANQGAQALPVRGQSPRDGFRGSSIPMGSCQVLLWAARSSTLRQPPACWMVWAMASAICTAIKTRFPALRQTAEGARQARIAKYFAWVRAAPVNGQFMPSQ